MTIKFDRPLDDPSIPDNNFEAMPIGEYLGVIEEAKEKESANGNDMIEFKIRLRGNEKYDNKVLFHYLVFGQEHSLEAAKKLMMALNQDIAGLKGISAEKLVGLPCRFKTKHEEYQGDTRDKIHYFVPVNKGESAEGGSQSDNEVPDLGNDIPF